MNPEIILFLLIILSFDKIGTIENALLSHYDHNIYFLYMYMASALVHSMSKREIEE